VWKLFFTLTIEDCVIFYYFYDVFDYFINFLGPYDLSNLSGNVGGNGFLIEPTICSIYNAFIFLFVLSLLF
jgi:hypothetical protein